MDGRILVIAGTVAIVLLSAACLVAQDGKGPPVIRESGVPTVPTHHTASGFRNPGFEDGSHGRGAFFRWQWDRLIEGLPREVPGGWSPPVTKPDMAPFRAQGPEPRIAWLGHDTFILLIGGTVVMTDPHLTSRASPLSWIGPKRQVALPLEIRELPHVDIVVLSHNHYDHMDRGTLLALNAQPGGPPQFLVPLGDKVWMEDQGIATARELDWWDQVEIHGLTLTFVPARHFSARTPFDTNRTLWGGWIVDHPSFRFYFAGDTGYAPLFKEIGKRFAPIDLAAIPIGAYEPRWFMGPVHANPEDAVQIHLDVGARRSIGMHWGTFQLTDESLDEPPKALGRALAAAHVSPAAFFTLGFGEERTFDPRPHGTTVFAASAPSAVTGISRKP